MSMPEHGKYEWLPILYDFVKVLEPKKIVEFGPGRGVGDGRASRCLG